MSNVPNSKNVIVGYAQTNGLYIVLLMPFLRYVRVNNNIFCELAITLKNLIVYSIGKGKGELHN